MLTGRVAQRGDAFWIGAKLIEVGNNRQVWGEQFNRKLADLQAVQDAISTEISDRLRVRLTVEERRQLTKRYTENTEAYQLYLKGRYYWNKKTPRTDSTGASSTSRRRSPSIRTTLRPMRLSRRCTRILRTTTSA